MNNQTLYVGCDVSSDNNYYCFLLGDGATIRKTSLPNNAKGSNQLVDLILEDLEGYDLSKLVFGLEATNNFHFHILNFLALHEKLENYDVILYRINAKLIKNFKDGYPDKSKTDKYDAFIIADKLRFGRLPEPFTPFNEFVSLKRLTRTRFHIIKQLEREMNYFLSNLYIKFSEYKKLPFSNTFGATSIALVTEFDIEEITQISNEKLIDFLIEKGKNHFTDPKAYAKEIKKIARHCYRIDRSVNKTINLILEVSLNTIQALKGSLTRIDTAINREISKFKHTLESIPGIGPVFSAGLLAEITNINLFDNDSKLAKYAGLTWLHKQSNQYKSEETHMNKSGNKYLRYYFIQAAESVRKNCDEYRDYYNKKYRESTKHKHRRALVLSARKLVRLIFVLLRKNTLYDPSRYLKNRGGGC